LKWCVVFVNCKRDEAMMFIKIHRYIWEFVITIYFLWDTHHSGWNNLDQT